MCQAVKCKVCGKTTWAGCGQHIAQVKRGVLASQWCDKKHTPEEIKAAQGPGIFERIAGFFKK